MNRRSHKSVIKGKVLSESFQNEYNDFINQLKRESRMTGGAKKQRNRVTKGTTLSESFQNEYNDFINQLKRESRMNGTF